MSMTTDPAARQAFIAGLRDLADFLADNPKLAVSVQETKILVSPYGSDEDCQREIDEFAAAAGVAVTDSLADGGAYEAVREFGPVKYQVFNFTAAQLAESDLKRSYADNIQVSDTSGEPLELGEAA